MLERNVLSNKFSPFPIRINDNLKIGYVDPFFKKWLYLAFQDRQNETFSNVRAHTYPSDNFFSPIIRSEIF